MPFLNLDPSAAEVIAPTLGAPLTAGEETLLSFANELKSTLGERDDVTPERLARWVNQAYRDLPTTLDLPESHVGIEFDSVADQALYLLPTELIRTMGASLVDSVNYSEGGTPLRKIDLAYYRKLGDLTDVVTSYLYQNKMVVLYPTPVAVKAIVIDAYILPQRLINADDSSIYSPDWNEAILLGARAKAFRSLLEFEMGNNAYNDYVGYIRNKINPKAEERTGMIAGFQPARRWRQVIRKAQERGDW